MNRSASPFALMLDAIINTRARTRHNSPWSLPACTSAISSSGRMALMRSRRLDLCRGHDNKAWNLLAVRSGRRLQLRLEGGSGVWRRRSSRASMGGVWQQSCAVAAAASGGYRGGWGGLAP
ncbi:hypothetical protein J5N97_024586 [Dioscorea zingiberensis]|uniref:Uncharacterized protein n=1 Tax=Dioscorea zingiberensis TaxID=325984 RepID=A0A9D5H8W8_9LILI|nr:hypothetical protein J5N97_024586 [Dioscorea zingiberensis]